MVGIDLVRNFLPFLEPWMKYIQRSLQSILLLCLLRTSWHQHISLAWNWDLFVVPLICSFGDSQWYLGSLGNIDRSWYLTLLCQQYTKEWCLHRSKRMEYLHVHLTCVSRLVVTGLWYPKRHTPSLRFLRNLQWRHGFVYRARQVFMVWCLHECLRQLEKPGCLLVLDRKCLKSCS